MKSVTRKTSLILAALVAALLLALLILALAVGPVLNFSATRRLAVQTLDSMTGFSWEIERIRFAYPFRLRVEGLTLRARADGGKFPVRVYAERAEIVSGLEALLHAQVDDIRVEGVRLDVGFASKGAARSAVAGKGGGLPLRIPDWAWRVRKASVRIAKVRVHSSGQTLLCLDDLYASWTHSPETNSGRVEISLNSLSAAPQPPDLVLLATPESITALSGPVVLPALDLAPLAGFAGLDAEVSGTLCGAVFPVPGPRGADAFYLDLYVEDPTLEAKNSSAGFSGGSLHLGGVVLLPAAGAGLAVFMDHVAGSIENLTLGGKSPGPALRNLDLTGSFGFDTLSDSADWTMDAGDREMTTTLRTAGTLDGVLSGTRRATASALARCRDLGAVQTALSPQLPLPKGTALRGEWTAKAALAGTFESMRLKGSASTSHFVITSGSELELPVRLEASFTGSVQKGRLEVLQVETNRLEIGEATAAKASADYGPEGVTGRFTADSIEAKSLVALLGPFLPEGLSAYTWGGTVSLSANAGTGTGKGSSVRGGFSAGLRDGKFSSPDYQRMGEGIDFDLHGSFSMPSDHASVGLDLDASLPKGEIVMGEIYGNLSKTRPRLQIDLLRDLESGALRIRSAGLVLDGVGTAGLEGRFSRGPRGVRASAKIKVGPILLGGLLDRVLRDTASGLYPAMKDMTAAGTFTLSTAVDVEGGAYRARGEVTLQGASLEDPSQQLSLKTAEVNLPFSAASAPERASSGRAAEPGVEPGTLTFEGIDFRGLEIPGIEARVLVADNRLELLRPVRIHFAGGSVNVPELTFQGLGYGSRKGEASLEIDGLDLSALAKAAGWKGIEGRLNGRFGKLAYEEGTWKLAGRLGIGIRDGELEVGDIEFEAPASGSPEGGCTVEARDIPLEVLTSGRIQPPLKGTLEGGLPQVKLSGGKLETEGAFTLSVYGGTVTLSKLSAGGLFGPDPFAQLDIDMKGIHLAELTTPLKFGRISGVLQGWIHGLRLRPDFPYAVAFDADLETVRERGVPRKIDATAVATLSRIGGSGQLAAILSRGLYRYFDEYYYKKMGLRATLEDGWLELHGMKKGDKEYLVTKAFRIPTLSMPITVMTANHKIRFKGWLEDLLRVGRGK